MIASLIKTAYREHLVAGGERWRIPEREHREEDLSVVWASDIGSCPLKAYLKRTKAQAKFPLSNDELLSSLHLMQQGVRDAEPIQEALIRKYGAQAEVQVEGMGVRGRVDVLATFPEYSDKPVVIEIKRRDGFPVAADAPEPRLSDVLQVMAYGAILDTPHMCIVLVNRYFVNVWVLTRDEHGYYTLTNDETGFKYEALDGQELNFMLLKNQIALHQSYLNASRSGTPEGMRDFMNAPSGWQCWQWVIKANKSKPNGSIKRRCEFFCHCDEDGPYPVTVADGRKTVHLPLGF